MARLTPKVRNYPRTGELVCGPFRGVRDSTDRTAADPALARGMQNMMVPPGPPGTVPIGRPGTTAMGTTPWTVAQAGGFTWTDGTGTQQTLAVGDGKVYAYNWLTEAWSVVISAANLATAGAALSTTARVALVPFADRLVISDGVNFALWWDGTPGAGGIIELPVKFYGPPSVYYSKLVGIDPARRYVMYWSEEGDATIGYDVTVGPYTYNNAWDNPGGYTDPLTAVIGTNDGLYAFRARITLAILGAMGPDFQTAGTRANIAPEIGTSSPWSLLELSQGVIFVDSDANPWLVKIGLPQPVPLWPDCAEALKEVPRDAMASATTIYDVASNQVYIGVATYGILNPGKWLTFHADSLQYSGTQTGWGEVATAGTVIDNDGVKRWSHTELVGGRIVAHGTLNAAPFDDVVQGVTVPVYHEIVGPWLGFDPAKEFFLNGANMGFTAGSVVTIGYETNRGPGTSGPYTLNTGTGGFRLDVSRLDLDRIGTPVTSSQATPGFAGSGRMVSTTIIHQVLSESFGHDVQRLLVSFRPGNPNQP